MPGCRCREGRPGERWDRKERRMKAGVSGVEGGGEKKVGERTEEDRGRGERGEECRQWMRVDSGAEGGWKRGQYNGEVNVRVAWGLSEGGG